MERAMALRTMGDEHDFVLRRPEAPIAEGGALLPMATLGIDIGTQNMAMCMLVMDADGRQSIHFLDRFSLYEVPGHGVAHMPNGSDLVHSVAKALRAREHHWVPFHRMGRLSVGVENQSIAPDTMKILSGAILGIFASFGIQRSEFIQGAIKYKYAHPDDVNAVGNTRRNHQQNKQLSILSFERFVLRPDSRLVDCLDPTNIHATWDTNARKQDDIADSFLLAYGYQKYLRSLEETELAKTKKRLAKQQKRAAPSSLKRDSHGNLSIQ